MLLSQGLGLRAQNKLTLLTRYTQASVSAIHIVYIYVDVPSLQTGLLPLTTLRILGLPVLARDLLTSQAGSDSLLHQHSCTLKAASWHTETSCLSPLSLSLCLPVLPGRVPVCSRHYICPSSPKGRGEMVTRTECDVSESYCKSREHLQTDKVFCPLISVLLGPLTPEMHLFIWLIWRTLWAVFVCRICFSYKFEEDVTQMDKWGISECTTVKYSVTLV